MVQFLGVRPNNEGKLYLNGVQSGTTNALSWTGEFNCTNADIILGGTGTGSYFNGTIDEVRIWDRSLSANEIKQQYYGNLYKYDLDKWTFYINESDLNIDANTYFAITSNLSGSENLTETRTIRILTKTTQYYDNRKMAVVWTGDDLGSVDINKFVNASNYAQSKKVVFSPAIITGSMSSSEWTVTQTEIDKGFVFPVSHSVSHETVPYTNTTLEVCGSQSHIIGNLTLPWQDQFNSSQYLVGWVEPGGGSDDAVRGNLSECNYLSDRSVNMIWSSWASWSERDGLYERYGTTASGDNDDLTTLNSTFDTVYSDGGIYHLYMHPASHNWSETDKIPQHLSYIGNRTDVWYVGWGQLYMYHYLEDRVTPTINLTTHNNQIITAELNVSGTERNKYGLSYPVTYAFAIPSVWSNVFVFYKNLSTENYTLMTEKTSNEYWNGIDAYRTNLSENGVYVSKGFPQENNEFYLKIIPVLQTNFEGGTTDLTTVSDISNITYLTIEKTSYGKINFSESVDLSAGGNLNTYVNISQNYISINSTALSELNKSATLTLYNLTYTNPRILKDGAVCFSSVCTEVSYSGGNFTFTVTSFSAYSAGETLTISSFSCSPTSAIVGETITCSCSATDAIDSSPTVSYTANPSTSSAGTFTTTCTATDDAGNSASSSISYSVLSSGGGTPTYSPTESNLQEGYSKQLYTNWKLNFKYNGDSHQLKLNSFDSANKTATITISSEPQTKTLSIGEEWKVNLNNDSYYDLLVRLDNVIFNRANIFIQGINETIVLEVTDDVYGNDEEVKDVVVDNIGKTNYWLYFISGIFIVIVVASTLYFVYRKKKKRK
ncbi:MAG: LamG domain-containing protein [Bacteroidetes bacterium]|nr:LamG domain-containing protein [Bacteroidota bacterium]